LKIIDRKDITEICNGLRREGKSIVFTNGCFDVIHPGHIYCLYMARKQGDLLVVGLNDDESVKRLKGPERPIFSQDERAELLASFFFVDYVVMFNEDTPLNLVLQVKPKVLVKGGDYDPETIVGKRETEADGGRLFVVPPLEGYSSSGLIKSVAEN